VAQDQHLAARIFKRVFHPCASDGFSGDEAADMKLLRHQHAFQRSNGVGQDKNIFAINKISGSKRAEAGERAAHRELQIGLWAVAGRAATFAFAVFVDAHGYVSALGKAGKELKEWIVGLEVGERVAAETSDEENRRVLAGVEGRVMMAS